MPPGRVIGFSNAMLQRCCDRVGTSVASVLAGAILFCASSAAAAEAPTASPSASGGADLMWSRHVEPILNRSCFKCHGGSKQKGGLDLRQPGSILAGGADGSVVVPGRPGESMLFQRLQNGGDDHMPPEKEPQLTVDEVSFVREWIATLPTPKDHPPIGGGSINSTASAPSLLELATSAKWQLPAGIEGPAAIDFFIEQHWREQHVSGNGVCDDRTFVRRVYLDLAGRIPKRQEADSFIASTQPKKREELVERLLAGSEYAQHMAEVLDVALMDRKGPAAEAKRRSGHWLEYLQDSVAANRPWDKMVAEMITARPEAPEQRGAAWFLYERKNNAQAMAEAVAPVAFGVSVACAQCHNHPLAHEIKQQQYWGLVAAFNRTTNADTDAGPALSESAVGGFVNFTNLKKESQPATLTFPNGKTIAEDRPADGAKEDDAPTKYLIAPVKGHKAGVPKFSRRQAIADAATHDNPLLARAFVNRTWAILLGRGFVNPVDQMDSRHPPSHPELLAWLSRDFEKNGYDIKHLIRTIVLSRTYQLDSGWPAATPPPQPELFARGLEKPLSAEVLARSLLTATGNRTAPDTDGLRQSLIVAFPAMFEAEYNPSLQQAMFLTNNPQFDSILRSRDGNLTARLLALPMSGERVRTAFIEILGRQPDDAEQHAMEAYLDQRSDRPEAGVRQMAWTLLTSTEFLLNH